MFWQASVLLAASGFQAINALPTSSGASATLNVRDDTQCKAGTNFYVCNINDFRGCCSVDPCAMPDGCPDDNQGDDPEQPAPSCKPGETTALFEPKMKTDGGEKTSDITLKKSGSSVTKQTMTFSGIPKEATKCSVAWYAGPERDFTVKDSGLTTVSEIIDGKATKIGQADFTNWDVTVDPPYDHSIGGDVDCKKEIVVAAELENDGEVFLAQNSETGWYLEYTC